VFSIAVQHIDNTFYLADGLATFARVVQKLTVLENNLIHNGSGWLVKSPIMSAIIE